ncbi:hypothetical protein QAD02_010117 [Eretmocerus hayati]|uniref:Uncharacterized protein n=1 Tax=Eretmocerus hayati TaxID=131215 RepID=A0ACC2NB70_9HYME|nr:hypothetical protein QAD02_010117 [Eretmocerus hayati]
MDSISESKYNQLKEAWTQVLLYLFLLTVNVQIASTALPLPKQWEVTQLKSSEVNYVWTLTDTNFHDQRDVCTSSSAIKSDDEQKWMIGLCYEAPGSSSYHPESGHDHGNFLIGLYYLSGKSDFVVVNYTITLMNETLHIIHTLTGSETFEQLVDQYFLDSEKFRKKMDKGKDHFTWSNDRLVINVNMSLRYMITEKFVDGDCSVTSQAELQSLKRKYQSFNDQPGCLDLVIETKNGKNITTTGCFLYPWIFAPSPMYSNVTYIDFDFEVVNEFIHFLQYGEAPRMKKMAKDLFLVAKNYVVDDLKRLSEKEICNSLSLDLDDLIQNLVFAHINGVSSVKSRIIHYIRSQPAYYLDNPQFEELQKSHPNLMQNIHGIKDDLKIEPQFIEESPYVLYP